MTMKMSHMKSPEQLVQEFIDKHGAPLLHEKPAEEPVGKVDECVSELVEKIAELEKKVSALSAEVAAGGVATLKLNVVNGDKTVSLEGLVHRDFQTILKKVSARRTSGFTTPVYMWGPPGTGKTTIMYQLGQALGLSGRVTVASVAPTDTKSMIVGFQNLSAGQFMEGIAYQRFKHGGLLGVDEVTNADAGLLVSLNALDGEYYCFPNGEVVQRHHDFYMVMADNTKGTGSTGGYQRQAQDAATLDRPVYHFLNYDEKLEASICGNEEWARWVQKVRAFVGGHIQQTVYITPRSSINGAALLANGLSPEDVMNATVFKLVGEDIRSTILSNVGAFDPAKKGEVKI